MKEKNFYGLILGLVLIALLGYGTYHYHKKTTIAESKIVELQKNLKSTQDELKKTVEDNSLLHEALTREQEKNNSFAGQLSEITNTVDTLTRLSKTDKELLQKYSRVYFLNENYIPSDLTPIDTKYVYDKSRPQLFHDRAWPFFKNLLEDATKNDAPLLIISAYRSFGEQSSLKLSYRQTYGSGSNQFSADQGYSEHQLGTTIDFTSPELGASFGGFDKTEQYNWLYENAYKYGFVLSYPKNNTHYQYEPWHWRYVGTALATYLHTQGKNFYDLDQRFIDTYLIYIFS